MENSNTSTNIHSKPEVNTAFRFTQLDKMQAITLTREILGASYQKKLNDNCYIGCVPLTDANFDDINDYYVRQRITIEACDIFVSVTGESSENIVDIPPIVNRMVKYIDCKLRFSFTVT